MHKFTKVVIAITVVILLPVIIAAFYKSDKLVEVKVNNTLTSKAIC